MPPTPAASPATRSRPRPPRGRRRPRRVPRADAVLVHRVGWPILHREAFHRAFDTTNLISAPNSDASGTSNWAEASSTGVEFFVDRGPPSLRRCRR